MQCRKCQTQYVGKSENTFNIRLNNHRKNAYKPTNDPIPARKHFHGNGNDFNRDAKFTIIGQIRDVKCIIGETCENFQNYFEIMNNKTRYRNCLIRLRVEKLECYRKSFYFNGAQEFNGLPLKYSF